VSARVTGVPLRVAEDESVFGGKAVSLGAAIRAGLPVPEGAALAAHFVEAIAAGDAPALATLDALLHIPGGRLAVRSSAIGEDSADASFAGQHVTRLNVRRGGVADAVRAVWESGRTPGALAYRARKGLPPEPRIAVVVQLLIEPIAAGVLFTRNPVTGADERMIEAAWGLGEAVVNGAVVPDRYRLDPSGRVLEVNPGDKDLKIWYGDGDGTVEIPVTDELRTIPCLELTHIEALHRLAERCRAVWGPHLDIEWALAPDGTPRLLQCRPITT
jgi:pyruvate, water dikinase